MPQVPRLTNRVQEAGLPNVRVPTDAPLSAFGGGDSLERAGRATQQGFQTAYEFAAEAKKHADDIAVLEGDQQLSGFLTYAETEFKTKRGKSVLDAQDSLHKEWGKKVEEVLNSASNRQQRESLERLAGSRFNDLNKTVQSHVSNELQKHDIETTKSYIDNERNAVSKSYRTANGLIDGERISIGLERQRAAALKLGERMGDVDVKNQSVGEMTKQHLREIESKTHAGIIESMLSNGEDRAASEYFRIAKPTLDAEAEARLGKAIKNSSVIGEAQRLSEEVTAKYGDMRAALPFIDKITDPEVKEKTKSLSKERFDLMEHGRKQSQDKLYQGMAKALSQGISIHDIQKNPRWVDLDPQLQTALENRSKSRPNDDKVWLDFLSLDMKQVAALSRSDFESKYWVHLDDGARAKAEGQWNTARDAANGNSRKGQEFTSLRNDKDMILDAINSSRIEGFNGRDTFQTMQKSDYKSSVYKHFVDRVDAKFEEFYNQNGKNPSDADKKKIINGLVIQRAFTKKIGADPEKPLAMMSDEEIKNAYQPIQNIAPNDRLKLINLARANGVLKPDITDERAIHLLKGRIERAYAAAQAGANRDQIISIMKED